jgi:hypothetical protein
MDKRVSVRLESENAGNNPSSYWLYKWRTDKYSKFSTSKIYPWKWHLQGVSLPHYPLHVV